MPDVSNMTVMSAHVQSVH